MAATIYLIHFSKPLKHARHYLGFTTDLAARLEQHASGQGARLLSVLASFGIAWQCVRTWPGDRKLERRLKNRKEAPALCPVCAGEGAMRLAQYPQKAKGWRVR
jgi:predicted GIY-YIG superfamily endonuclease